MTNLLKDKKFSDIQIKKYIIPFGLCSYLFITSAIFSRDIHVCLIYTIAAYISLKDHVKGRLLIFILLFFLAAGLRPQNGIAYLIYPIAFYWKTITKKIGLFGIGVIALICLVLFYYLQDSLELLYESLGTYDDFSKSNTGGIFIEFYSLPFPLNTIVMVIYMALMPLPLFKCCIGMGGTWLNLPTIFSSYLIYVCFMVCIYYLCHSKFKGAYVGTILVCLIAYAGIIYGSPDERRAFAAIPGLYMCYALVKQRIPKGHYIRYRNIGWMLITVVQLFFIVYVYTR
jgi:hypothetical protein